MNALAQSRSRPAGSVLLYRQCTEIIPSIFRILERVRNCGSGNVKNRPRGSVELEFRDTANDKMVGHRLKGRRSYSVAEDIVCPSDVRGGRQS